MVVCGPSEGALLSMFSIHDLIKSGTSQEPRLQSALFAPLQSFLSRPHKSFRANLVDLGFELFSPQDSAPSEWQEDFRLRTKKAIETLHAGSLIVDDIQDDSELRRGSPCLHHEIGVPLALNAGNWLYFFAYQQILESQAPHDIKLKCLADTTDILLRAHQGQAIDLSTRMGHVPASEVPLVCRQSLEGKSGALMEFALVLGARVAGADDIQVKSARVLGRELGVHLQMFDDLGNLKVEKPTPKHLEDLIHQRPSFVWWLVAEHFPDNLAELSAASKTLPCTLALKQFLSETPVLEQGRQQALKHQQELFNWWRSERVPHSPAAFEKIRELSERIASAYF